MSTLLEKTPPAVSTSPAHPPHVLRTRHQWLRWRGVLTAGIGGLAATLLVLWLVPPLWHTAPRIFALEIWLGGLFITALAMAVAYRFAPESLLVTAQTLDERFGAKNRLEAVVGLQDSASPLAEAHRQETALYLGNETQARPVRILPWLAGALAALVFTHLLLLVIWILPALFHTAPKAPVPPPAPKAIPKASIVWRSPEPESKANPVEEVPTQAIADSSTGLRDLTLEVSLNGELKKSTPIPATPYDKAGSHTIKASLFMDELDAQPFDVVSYYLRGQRVFDQKLPDVTSAIQFIQVRPFRDDVSQGLAKTGKGVDLLIRLKLAQLRSVKENFVLAHTDLPVTNPVRMTENSRVGKNQADLSAKTEEVVQAFIEEGVPTGIIDLLRQSEPFMDDGAKKILATQNLTALDPQQKALNRIVEVEKFFHKGMAPPPPPGPSGNDPKDPFRDKQKHELTQRLKALSGQLETLAKNQMNLSNELDKKPGESSSSPAPGRSPASPPGTTGSPSEDSGAPAADGLLNPPPAPAPQAVDPFGPDAEKGSFAVRQTRVLQGVGVLQNGNNVLPKGVTDALAAAQKDAGDSVRSLNAGDTMAAREPAAAAARDLQQAIQAMNASGEEETKLAMEEAQRKLNDLAGHLSSLAQTKPADAGSRLMDIAKQVYDVRQNLETAADHQQESGSAKGAAQLNRLAQSLQEQKFASELAAMSKTGLDPGRASTLANMLQDLATQTGHGLAPGQPGTKDYVALVNALESTRANLAHLAEKAGGFPAGTLSQTPGATPGSKPESGGQGSAPQPDKGGPGQQGSQPGAGKLGQQGSSPSASEKGQPSKGEGKSPGQGQGQGPGQGPDQQAGQQTGKSSQSAGTSPGESPAGSGPGSQQGQNPPGTPTGSQPPAVPGSDPGSGPNGSAPGGSGGTGQSGSGPEGAAAGNSVAGGISSPTSITTDPHAETSSPPNALSHAYREVLANLKNQTQQTEPLVKGSAQGVLQVMMAHDNRDTGDRPVTEVDVVRFYTDVQKPLEKLILELEALQQHAERTDIIKTPNLDDTPPAYRTAVYDYFESVSRDYHPAPVPDNSKP